MIRRIFPLASLLACACSPGFYLMYDAPLAGTTVNINRGPPPEPAADEPPKSVQPYLTLTATGHTENLFNTPAELDKNLRVLKLDAEFKGANSQVFSVPIFAYDIEGTKLKDLAANGREILKNVPIRFADNTSFNMTLRSSAIEKNLADAFGRGLNIVISVAGPALGTTLSPQAMEALNAASGVLDQFKSPKDGTESSRILTLNPSNGAIEKQFKVWLLVPTGGSSKLNTDTTIDPQGPGVQTTAYAERVKELKNLKFTVCSTDRTKLCEVGANNAETEFSKYAYFMLVPTISYRIADSRFLWKVMAGGGSCPFKADEYEKYIGAVSEWGDRMTNSQQAQEREIIGSAGSLVALRSAAGKPTPDYGAMFDAISNEWSRARSTDWLYRQVDTAGESYESVQSNLRKCMINEAEAKKPGFFKKYVKGLEATIAAEDIDLSNEPDPAKKEELKKMQIKSYEVANLTLVGVREALKVAGLDLPQVTSGVNGNIATVEFALQKLEFDEPIEWAYSAQDRDKGRNELNRLITVSACGSCIERAKKALTDTNPRSIDAKIIADAADVRLEAGKLKGLLEVLVSSSEAKNVQIDSAALAELNRAIDNATRLSAEAVKENSATKMRQATDELTKANDLKKKLGPAIR